MHDGDREDAGDPNAGSATALLHRMRAGDRGAEAAFYSLVGDELYTLAQGALRRQFDATLQPTALVHEAWLRLAYSDGSSGNDRAHFLAVAARCMRAVLVDHSRRRRALKRGGGRPPIAIELAIDVYERRALDLVELDDALEVLSGREERQGRIVELRFFGGLELNEVADVLGVSRSTVDREWRLARLWLAERLGA